MDGINLDSYKKDELEALAIEIGRDEDDIAKAKTKADLIALINGEDVNASDDAEVAPEGAVVFRVNGRLVDPNGKPVKG